MKLTATPFNPQTGELLPVYRDAYLRGDLGRSSARAVEAYLRHDADQAHSTLTRWHEMTTKEAEPVTTTWVQQQLSFIQQQPRRFRQRALSIVAVAALLAGASMASTGLSSRNLATAPTNFAVVKAAGTAVAEASAARLVTMRGRILDEKGQPLVGATVLRKGTGTGVSTNAKGEYALQMTAGSAATATLQYGYAGYHDQELKASDVAPGGVTLQPRPRAEKRRHWLFF